jgi:hypothetical protein
MADDDRGTVEPTDDPLVVGDDVPDVEVSER